MQADDDKDAGRPALALEAEVAFFNAHRDQWIASGQDMRWVAIKGQQVVGFYDSMAVAYSAGVAVFSSAPFLVRQVRREDPTAIIKRVDLRKRA
jgi:hypothetical protein